MIRAGRPKGQALAGRCGIRCKVRRLSAQNGVPELVDLQVACELTGAEPACCMAPGCYLFSQKTLDYK